MKSIARKQKSAQRTTTTKPEPVATPPAAKPAETFKEALAGIYFSLRGSTPGHAIDTALADLSTLIETLEVNPEGFADATVIRQMIEIHDVIDLASKALTTSTATQERAS